MYVVGVFCSVLKKQIDQARQTYCFGHLPGVLPDEVLKDDILRCTAGHKSMDKSLFLLFPSVFICLSLSLSVRFFSSFLLFSFNVSPLLSFPFLSSPLLSSPRLVSSHFLFVSVLCILIFYRLVSLVFSLSLVSCILSLSLSFLFLLSLLVSLLLSLFSLLFLFIFLLSVLLSLLFSQEIKGKNIIRVRRCCKKNKGQRRRKKKDQQMSKH